LIKKMKTIFKAKGSDGCEQWFADGHIRVLLRPTASLWIETVGGRWPVHPDYWSFGGRSISEITYDSEVTYYNPYRPAPQAYLDFLEEKELAKHIPKFVKDYDLNTPKLDPVIANNTLLHEERY